ncbi:hypothetical protein C8R43DRAFT_957066 [Mycena crocata]|nr:hypothetical protein C8R43DRAFT_957066 [Mycena crocata]
MSSTSKSPKSSSPASSSSLLPNGPTVDGRMLLTDFFKKHPVSQRIRTILVENEFDTAEALCCTSDEVLKECGMKPGQIQALKAALSASGRQPWNKDKPSVFGGVGGKGGGGSTPGSGGIGRGAQVQPIHTHLVKDIGGGEGGDVIANVVGTGGTGGIGEGGGIIAPLYIPPNTTVQATLTLSEFFQLYTVPPDVQTLLTTEGFSTAAALRGTTEETFTRCKLKPGHIEQVRTALAQWELDLAQGKHKDTDLDKGAGNKSEKRTGREKAPREGW